MGGGIPGVTEIENGEGEQATEGKAFDPTRLGATAEATLPSGKHVKIRESTVDEFLKAADWAAKLGQTDQSQGIVNLWALIWYSVVEIDGQPFSQATHGNPKAFWQSFQRLDRVCLNTLYEDLHAPQGAAEAVETFRETIKISA